MQNLNAALIVRIKGVHEKWKKRKENVTEIYKFFPCKRVLCKLEFGLSFDRKNNENTNRENKLAGNVHIIKRFLIMNERTNVFVACFVSAKRKYTDRCEHSSRKFSRSRSQRRFLYAIESLVSRINLVALRYVCSRNKCAIKSTNRLIKTALMYCIKRRNVLELFPPLRESVQNYILVQV